MLLKIFQEYFAGNVEMSTREVVNFALMLGLPKRDSILIIDCELSTNQEQ